MEFGTVRLLRYCLTKTNVSVHIFIQSWANISPNRLLQNISPTFRPLKNVGFFSNPFSVFLKEVWWGKFYFERQKVDQAALNFLLF